MSVYAILQKIPVFFFFNKTEGILKGKKKNTLLTDKEINRIRFRQDESCWNSLTRDLK